MQGLTYDERETLIETLRRAHPELERRGLLSVLLYRFMGLTQAEVAQVLGVNQATVSRRLDLVYRIVKMVN